ncbi:hypothetical protein ACWEN3_14310 [Streptomyces sp. NPDC004561]
MGDGGGSSLRRGLDALSKFKGEVDKALNAFERSPGSSSKLADHALSRASFGGSQIPFGEADDLHSQYEHVHERLVYLSKTLNLQIEALTCAAHAADVTYDGSEDEARRRFWEIKTQLDEEYQKSPNKQDPAPKNDQQQDETPQKDTRQHTDQKSSGVSSS